MRKIIFNFLGMLLLIHRIGATAHANPLDTCVFWLRNSVFNSVVKDLSGQTLLIEDKQLATKTKLVLGQKLGAGFGGAVYQLVTANDSALVTSNRLVIKLPLILKTKKHNFALPHSRFLIHQEKIIYDLALEKIKNFNSSKFWPQDPYWSNHAMPVVPILRTIKSDLGILLIKPEIKGISLRQLAQKNGHQFPQEVLDSLKQLYDWAQITYELKAPGIYPVDPTRLRVGRHFWIDLNATNLLWVDEAESLKILGFKKPGIVLFELGEYPRNKYHHTKMSFQDLVAEYLDQALAE